MTLQWLLAWWNLIFVVPFAIALTYLGVYAMTGITFGDSADAEFDTDADFDADVDVDGDLQADIDPHVDVDAHDLVDHDLESHNYDDAKSSVTAASFSLLHLIGVGRVPLSLLVMIFLFTWSISGFAATQWLHQTMSSGERIALFSMPTAAFVSMAMTSAISRLLGSAFPMNEAPAMALAELVGQRAIAVLPITDTFGLARVGLDGGASMQVPCRVADGEPSIASHANLVVLRLDRAARLFYVTTPDRLEAHRSATTVP